MIRRDFGPCFSLKQNVASWSNLSSVVEVEVVVVDDVVVVTVEVVIGGVQPGG